MDGKLGAGSNGSDLAAVLVLIEKIDRKLGKASTSLVDAQEKLVKLKTAVTKLAKVLSEPETTDVSEGESSSSEEIFPRPTFPPSPFPEWFSPQ